MPAQNSFILFGGRGNADEARLREFSSGKEHTTHWSCNSKIRKGDELWFYITAPRMAIIAVAQAKLDAKAGAGGWSYGVRIENVRMLDSGVSLAELRDAFPDWGWARQPQAKVQLTAERRIRLHKLAYRASELQPTSQSEAPVRIAFGDAEQNAIIEKRAIETITRKLRAEGFLVVSREAERIGYDLDAVRGNVELHIEVKGTSGSDPNFIITKNEVERARSDKKYRLAIVCNAGSRSPQPEPFLQGRDIEVYYELSPLAYQAVLRQSKQN